MQNVVKHLDSKQSHGGTMRVSTKEYCLLHNVYLTAELLSQALYMRQNPGEAQLNLNRALVEYKQWSDKSSARFKELHRNKRTENGSHCNRLGTQAKKLVSRRRRYHNN